MRQRQTHHGRLDAFGQRALVELLERSGLDAGPDGGGFEQAFQIMDVILIKPRTATCFLRRRTWPFTKWYSPLSRVSNPSPL